MGTLSDDLILGFKLPWGESILNFTYDPNTGYLESGGYVVFAQTTVSVPLILVTFTAGDGVMALPPAYPLV
jgi:hypothetical protein